LQDTNIGKPGRQNRAVEEPQGWTASLALRFSSGAASCRVVNMVIPISLVRALKTTARWKSPLVAQGPRSGPFAVLSENTY
jgi:hypothetical protein